MLKFSKFRALVIINLHKLKIFANLAFIANRRQEPCISSRHINEQNIEKESIANLGREFPLQTLGHCPHMPLVILFYRPDRIIQQENMIQHCTLCF